MGQSHGGLSLTVKSSLAIAAIVMTCWLIYEFSGPPRDPGTKTATSDTTTDGRMGMMLGVKEGSQPELFLVGDSKEVLREYTKALVSGDQYGKTALIADGRIFPVKSGTRVLVLEHGFTVKGIRILDGKHAGRIAWIEAEFVIPIR